MNRPPVVRIHAEDLVVDNFAGGGGASLGIEWALGRSPDIAINHDPEAVAMHAANHPRTRHMCGNVWDVNPKGVCGGRPVALAWFSPDCTYFSKARGAKPFRDPSGASKRRALAWVVVRWAREVRPRVILMENVEEFADWGPLTPEGRPDPTRVGLTFRVWLGKLKAAGYEVEMRELRAHDYGAPTIRKRLFIIARCDGQPIVWPEPTHGPGRPNPHRVAAECIQWEIPCRSIFGRKKPLADKTLARIARGVQRFVIDAKQPFIVPVTHGRENDSAPHGLDRPLRTITGAHRGELALVAPTLIQTGYGERPGQAPRVPGLHVPLGTVVGGGAKRVLVAAFLAKHNGGHEATGSTLDEAMHTLTAQSNKGFVAATFIRTDMHKSNAGCAYPVDEPARTVTSSGGHAVVASHMLKLRGSCKDGQDWERPCPSIMAEGTHLGEVRVFLLKYYRTGIAKDVQLSFDSLTTKPRFGIVYVQGEPYAIADIGMRMLAPRELYRAQGFGDEYVIEPLVDGEPISKTAQIRMVGNSVCPPIAAALVAANVGQKGVVAA